ncbi:MAG: site-specific DNA-methyltransferase [Candidatus Sungbacteria bacterium]|nr:site-specific DNA-methyltransferase [Candidatus Sungbacteria bacterium]
MPKTKEIQKKTIPENLPKQDKFFATTGLKRSVRAGTQLPDPTQAPYGFDPSSQFKHLFPALELPILKPPASHHPEDRVSFDSPELPPHELYLGDNLYLLRQMPSESIDLIYIDPPFFSNRTYTQIWGDDNEVRSFDDIFADGMFSYLAWLNARLWEMKRVLKSTGSIYVHCDWHASHYIKTEMDKIFGYDNFLNEIIWGYRTGGTSKSTFARKHDILMLYSKASKYKFNVQHYKSWQQKKYNFNEKYPEYFDEKEQRWYHLAVARDVWEDINVLGTEPGNKERIGYPTQKPEALLERILKASSDEGDVVADFFMGGGTTGAVVLKNNRCFIGCDISRVAVSVTASRLLDIAESISGIVASKNKPQTLGLQVHPVADIQIGYVGSYPIEKFEGIAQNEFIDFVCRLYGAGAFTGKSKYIHGLANGKLIISVGPADPDEQVSLAHVQGLVEEVVRQYAEQLKNGEERILQVVGWGFDPAIEAWKGQAITALNKRNVKLQIELISLSSESFRQKIFRQIGEANLDLKFNRLNRLLSFSASPYAGKIVVEKQNGLTLKLRLDGAKAIGTGRLINCQWDFSYDGARFASREYALNREGSQGHFEAKFDIEYTFEKPGEYIIATRVQDNFDGEAVAVMRLTISNKAHKLQEVNL